METGCNHGNWAGVTMATCNHVSCIARLDQQSGSVPSQALVLENQWRILENMKAQFVAVNGIRKVACVVR